MPKSAAGVLFIQESIVVFKIHSRSPILDSANRSGQEVHEDEQGQVEKDEEPEIQPVGVFRKPVHPGLRCLILVPPSSFERAPPFPDTVGTRRRLAHLHLRVVSLPRNWDQTWSPVLIFLKRYQATFSIAHSFSSPLHSAQVLQSLHVLVDTCYFPPSD